MPEIPKEESKVEELGSIRQDIIKTQAQISILERKNERIFKLLEKAIAELKTNRSITTWMFNETVGNVGKHIPDEIKKLVDGG